MTSPNTNPLPARDGAGSFSPRTALVAITSHDPGEKAPGEHRGGRESGGGKVVSTDKAPDAGRPDASSAAANPAPFTFGRPCVNDSETDL